MENKQNQMLALYQMYLCDTGNNITFNIYKNEIYPNTVVKMEQVVKDQVGEDKFLGTIVWN